MDDNVIARIIDVEKECAEEVEKAELEYRQNIEAHKKVLEEKKAREFDLIIAAGKEKLTETIDTAKKQADIEFTALQQESEGLYKDRALNETIKEKVLSILLAS